MPDTIKEKDVRHLYAYIEKSAGAINEDDHSINFVISSDRIDRHDERVETDAVHDAILRKGEFVDNPVALACHLHRLSDGMPPSVGSWDTDSLKKLKHHCEMRLNFAVDTVLGLEYWKFYSKKHMRAVSIGFGVLDAHEEVIKGNHIYVITKIELIEISCVAVGANRQALSKLKDFYLHNSSDDRDNTVRVIMEIWQEVKQIQQQITGIEDFVENSLEEIKLLLIPDPDEHAKRLLGDASEQLIPAGDNKNAERQLKRIETALSIRSN